MLRPAHMVMLGGVIVLEVSIYLLQKTASLHGQSDGVRFYVNLVRQPWVWMMAPLLIAQLFAWTAVLARVDLSVAYPITSLSYPITAIISALLFHERVRWEVGLGLLLITLGVTLLSAGGERCTESVSEADRRCQSTPPSAQLAR